MSEASLTVEQRIEMLHERIDGLVSDIGGLWGRCAELETSIEHAKDRAYSHTSEAVNNLEHDISSLRSDISSLESRVDSAERGY